MTTQPVACPSCHQTDDLREQALRPTWQPVKGLRADGDCESYGEFDYGDDTIVVGYSCGCGWSAAAELTAAQLAHNERFVTRLLAHMANPTQQREPT